MGLYTVLLVAVCLSIFQLNYCQCRNLNAPASRVQRSVRYTSVDPYPYAQNDRKNANDQTVSTTRRYVGPSVTVKVPLGGASGPSVTVKIQNNTDTDNIKDLPTDFVITSDPNEKYSYASAYAEANSTNTDTQTITATESDAKVINGVTVAEAGVITDHIRYENVTETMSDAEAIAMGENATQATAIASTNSGETSASGKASGSGDNIVYAGDAKDTYTKLIRTDTITESGAIAEGDSSATAEAAAISAADGDVSSTASSSATGDKANTEAATATQVITTTSGTNTIDAAVAEAEGKNAPAVAITDVVSDDGKNDASGNASGSNAYSLSESETYTEPEVKRENDIYADSTGNSKTVDQEQITGDGNPEENKPENESAAENADSGY